MFAFRAYFVARAGLSDSFNVAKQKRQKNEDNGEKPYGNKGTAAGRSLAQTRYQIGGRWHARVDKRCSGSGHARNASGFGWGRNRPVLQQQAAVCCTGEHIIFSNSEQIPSCICLLYTSDAADEL